ncbi:MAG: carbohydrate ABC transporter permease [Ruminiclostridium sp.]
MDSKGRIRVGYCLLIPTLLIIAIFIAYPVLNTIYQSFFELRTQTITHGARFVGFANYEKLFKDPLMYQSLKFTVIFTAVAVVLETILGMTCAMIMNRTFKGQGLVRAIILIPWAVPTIVSGLMWQFMFAESSGIINYLLMKSNVIAEPVKWITAVGPAFLAIIIADVWKTSPYMSLQLLSGLQIVSKELYEAASIDGANVVQRFFRITLPVIKPILLVSMLFRTIQSFRIYDLIVAMTNGGPANSTQSLSLFTVKNYFQYGNIGYGAAAAVLTFAISLLIALIFSEGMKTKMKEAK